MSSKSFESYSKKIFCLLQTIKECEAELVSETPSDFIYKNANFLTKSYLISLCAYLEIYLKDVLEEYLIVIKKKIETIEVPHNLIRWCLESKPKSDSKINSLLDTKKHRLTNFDLSIKKKDLDQFISGNPFRTKELFLMFGFELEKCPFFNDQREIIQTIVNTRNNILHYDDDASNLSNADVIANAKEFLSYAESIDELVVGQIIPT